MVNTIIVPTNNYQAREVAFDINKDGTVDNQLGMVLGTLASQGFDVQASASATVAEGSLVTLLSVRTPSLKNAKKKVTVKLFKGVSKVNPDLDGGGTFSVDKAAPFTSLRAKIADKVVTSKPGTVRVALPRFMPGLAPVSYDLAKGQISAKCSRKRCTAGRMGGGISTAQINSKFIPQLGTALRALVAADCPSGYASCTPQSVGKSSLDLFDTNHDDLITDQEIKDNSLIQSLLAPDPGPQRGRYGGRALDRLRVHRRQRRRQGRLSVSRTGRTAPPGSTAG